MHYAACGLLGMVTSAVFVGSTNYYTDYEYAPVRLIAASSITGHGTNIITGISVGLKSTAIPTITACIVPPPPRFFFAGPSSQRGWRRRSR